VCCLNSHAGSYTDSTKEKPKIENSAKVTIKKPYGNYINQLHGTKVNA
jgi:hypothetical protein